MLRRASPRTTALAIRAGANGNQLALRPKSAGSSGEAGPNTTGRKRPSGRKKRSRIVKKKLSRTHKPDDLSLEAWQIGLRREFGRQQKFKLKNLGGRPVFSDFEVTNPQTKRTYRVAIRGRTPGVNFCSCPDFTVNTLGTCKHIEFTLHKLAKQPGGKKALNATFQPPYSEIYLQYGAKREVVFRPGTSCPAELKTLARRFFDREGRLRDGAAGKFPAFLKKAAACRHELRCYDDALGFGRRGTRRACTAWPSSAAWAC